MTYIPEGYEVVEVDENGNRSWYVTCSIARPMLAKTADEARERFKEYYLQEDPLKNFGGELYDFEIKVTPGPLRFKKKEA